MDNKNKKKIIIEKNNIPVNQAGNIDIKRKRGRPKKTENIILNNSKNNKKIGNKKNNTDPVENAGNKPVNQDQKNTGIIPVNNGLRKRGRPKGSTDITQRKTRKDNIQNVATDEVKQKILRFNMELFKLPRITDKNDFTQVQDRTFLFFELCEQYSMTPTLAGYSLSLGIDRVTLYNWLNDRIGIIKNRECYNILKTAYDIINSGYENLLTEGKIIPVSAFFLLQNNYGYKQQTDHVITAKQENQETEEDILNRANLLQD